MGFAAFSIFFVITGIVALQLIQMQPVPFDIISFFFILWNFSVSHPFPLLHAFKPSLQLTMQHQTHAKDQKNGKVVHLHKAFKDAPADRQQYVVGGGNSDDVCVASSCADEAGLHGDHRSHHGISLHWHTRMDNVDSAIGNGSV